MASKLVFVLTLALAVGAANTSAVNRRLRQHHIHHKSGFPVSLITHNRPHDQHHGKKPPHDHLLDKAQECGTPVKVTADDMNDLDARCPKSCPLFVDPSSTAKNVCSFACVANSVQSCKDKNPMTPVPDPVKGVCRRCDVVGCQICNPDGTERCATCMEGYMLTSSGRCGYTWGYYIGYCTIILLLVVVALVIVIVIGWIVDLSCREVVNKKGLHHAVEVRSRAKLHMPKTMLFLPKSAVKTTDKAGHYEVVNDIHYSKSQCENNVCTHTAASGEILTGVIEDGWFHMDAPRKLWPLTTNLCREDVAGPAVTLLFNFQAATIIWALVIVVTWKLVASYTDEELLILGKKASETDRQNCIVVQWGHETQDRLMYVKVGFLLFTYLFSFIGAIFHGIRQWRIYTTDTGDTHRDFCAILTGLPPIPGDVLVEEELAKKIHQTTGQTVIGVSVGWEAHNQYEDFQAAMDFRLSELQSKAGHTPRDENTEEQATNTEGPQQSPRLSDDTPTGEFNHKSSMRRARRHAHGLALKVEGAFLHPATQAVMTRGRQKKNLTQEQSDDDNDDGKKESFLCREAASGSTNLTASVVSLDTELLKHAILELRTAATAFVIFESEISRNAAVEALKEDPMEFRFSNKKGEEETCLLSVESPEYEPQSVLWQNLSSDHSWLSKVKKMGWMFGVVLMTCLFLAIFEYGYAIIQINNARSSGEEGITLSFILFTILVCSMMACLCAISATVAEMAGFERVGHRETCFVLLYTFSVILQVSLDAVIGYFVGTSLMAANGIRTYDGTLIEDLHPIDDFTQVFESYAMQKHIGVTILSFGFPCAFLVPFLVEPLVSIFLPYKIMSLLVGSHPELKGNSAEGYMQAMPMDLGRYGDCMINVIIASMILWFPSGFNLTMFTFLLCSHCYIYLYDHYRMLRSVASCYMSTYDVDFWAQWIFSIPCGIICGALTFKLNCEPYLEEYVPGMQWAMPGFHWGKHCAPGGQVWIKVAIAFFGHIAVHTCALLCIMKFCGKNDPAGEDNLYKDTAERIPCSWFSGNLIHCLRSEYVYAHDPPQDMCVLGKEHLMRLNPKIGAFFKDKKAEGEDYNAHGLKTMTNDLTKLFKKSVSRSSFSSQGQESQGQESESQAVPSTK